MTELFFLLDFLKSGIIGNPQIRIETDGGRDSYYYIVVFTKVNSKLFQWKRAFSKEQWLNEILPDSRFFCGRVVQDMNEKIRREMQGLEKYKTEKSEWE